MKEIKLSQGFVTIVDDEDFEELSKYKWYYNHGYAKRKVTLDGKQATLPMHTVVMGNEEGLETDHVSGNTLDNRRENLRHVTHAQNMQNMAPNKNTSSQYKGIRWHKANKKWTSQITIDGKICHLGCYESEREAAIAYNDSAARHYGEYARLNTILEG